MLLKCVLRCSGSDVQYWRKCSFDPREKVVASCGASSLPSKNLWFRSGLKTILYGNADNLSSELKSGFSKNLVWWMNIICLSKVGFGE